MRAVAVPRRGPCAETSSPATTGDATAGGPTAWLIARATGLGAGAPLPPRRAGGWRLVMTEVARAASTTCRTRHGVERESSPSSSSLSLSRSFSSSPTVSRIHADLETPETTPPVLAGRRRSPAVRGRAARRATARAASTTRRPGPRLARRHIPGVPATPRAQHRCTAGLSSHAASRTATVTEHPTPTRSASAQGARIWVAAAS